jgi:hypothetical protein
MSKGKSTHHQNNSLRLQLSNNFFEIFSPRHFSAIFIDSTMISFDCGLIILNLMESAIPQIAGGLGREGAQRRLSRQLRMQG